MERTAAAAELLRALVALLATLAAVGVIYLADPFTCATGACPARAIEGVTP